MKILRFFSVIREVFGLSLRELYSNKLRSFLSTLGITIGIFCIVGVKSAVDSLEANISKSLDKLGNDVLYVDKWPWDEDPGDNFWKYQRRPNPDFKDFEAIVKKVKNVDKATLAVIMPSNTIKYESSSVQGAYMAGVTFDYGDLYKLEFEEGRYFTPYEYQNALDKVVIGYEIREALFKDKSAVGKYINVRGRKMQIIGVLALEGESFVQVMPFDRALFISYNTARKIINVRFNNWGTLLSVKAVTGVSLDDLEGEVIGAVRSGRQLRPKEADNFNVNRVSTFDAVLKPFFNVLNMVGFIIGIFAILVGMFNVANIMFVSVKERTNIIGIKKALGAKQGMILSEFLMESVFLCLAGGAMGVLAVFGILKLISMLIDFDLFLSTPNLVIAVGLSVIIGMLAGALPAWQAAKLDPVEAIRK